MYDLESVLIYESYVSLLKEMPYNHGWSSNSRMESPELNYKEFEDITTNDDYTLIDNFEGYDIYELDLNFGKKFLYLLKNYKVRGYYAYQELDNDFIQTRQMYQLKSEKGLLRNFFINYILKRFRNILSDTSLSENALNFWIKAINELKYKVEFGVYHDNEFYELENSEELKEFHKEDPEFSNYVFYVKLI